MTVAHPFPDEVPALPMPGEGAPAEVWLAAFGEACDIGPLEWSDASAAGRSAADIERGFAFLSDKKRGADVQARIAHVRQLASKLATLDDERAAARLSEVILKHPSSSLRLSVAEAVIGAGGPSAAIDALASLLDAPMGSYSEEHHLGTLAIRGMLVLTPPRRAMDKLAPFLAHEVDRECAVMALRDHEGDVDDGIFEAVRGMLGGGVGASETRAFFEIHAGRPAARAALARHVEDVGAGRARPAAQLYQLLLRVKVPEAAAALVRCAERALSDGDWRLTQPLNVLAAMDDAATIAEVLPALRALCGGAPARAKRPAQAVVALLEQKLPTAARPAEKAPKRKARSRHPELETRLRESGLGDERSVELVKLVRTRIDLEPSPMPEAAPGATRLGGEPDLPVGSGWPHVECTAKSFVLGPQEYPTGTLPEPVEGTYRVPLAFVAQLALADLAPHDQDRLLPKSGMLWFFARQEVVPKGKGELQRVACHVIFAEAPGPLQRTEPPPTLPRRERYAPAAVSLTSARPLPPDAVAARLALLRDEAAAFASARRPGEDGATPHACLGWARANHYRGVPGAKEQLLLAVGSDAVSGFHWGDAGSIFFLLPSSALAKRDFAKTYCVMDE